MGELLANLDAEPAVERARLPHDHEQDDLRSTGRALGALLHGHRLADLGHFLEDLIDLGRADPDAADVHHSVGPAVKARAALTRELDQVPMCPDTLVLAEVRV